MSSPPIQRLRVLAGPSPSKLTDISALVNTAQPHTIESSRFSGRVVVHVKGFPDAEESEYFEREDRQNVTWSIQMQGRFMQPVSSNDVLFGNTFDRPLKLPWGSGAALKFMHFIDPTLEHDLGGPKPWALSPLIATMPHFVHTQLSAPNKTLPPFPPPAPRSISDDTKLLCKRIGEKRHRASRSGTEAKNETGRWRSSSDSSSGKSGNEEPQLEKASKRRTYFSNVKNRRQVTFSPDDVLTTDFCYGFLSFPSLALNLPGGISFDLKKYWDGQPVRFVCVEREQQDEDDSEESLDEEDRSYWCIVFEAVES